MPKPRESLDAVSAGVREIIGAKQYDEALATYERALTLDPTSTDTWIARGDALGFLGRADDRSRCEGWTGVLRLRRRSAHRSTIASRGWKR